MADFASFAFVPDHRLDDHVGNVDQLGDRDMYVGLCWSVDGAVRAQNAPAPTGTVVALAAEGGTVLWESPLRLP